MEDPREGPQGFERARLRGSIAQKLFGEDPVRLERYVVLERVGQGGMGIVYRAFDPRLERVVALKVTRLREQGTQRERLLREAKVLAKLNHPHVLTVHDTGVAGDELFVATEFVQAGTLRDWCEAHPAGDGRTDRLVEFALQAARGLAAAHEAGLVHRDIKPANLMVGDDGRLRVADFGIAREQRSDSDDTERSAADDERASASSSRQVLRTRTGALLGTPAYMAPEQFRGAATERSDQFAWAVTFYEAICGVRPFERDAEPGTDSVEPESPSGDRNELQPPRPGHVLPEPIRRVLLRCLQPDPRERFDSMAAVADALEASRRPRGRMVVPIALAGGALALGWFALSRRGEPEASEEDPCATARTAVDAHWDDARGEKVRAALAGTSVSYASDAASRVEATLERYAAGWHEGRVDACEAVHVRNEQSATLMDARVRCLDDRARRLDAAVALLAEADDELMPRVVQIAGALPSVEACSDPTYVTAQAPPPSDPEQAARVAEEARRLAEARTLIAAGRYADAKTLGESVLLRARELEHDPLLARALAQLGWTEQKNGDSDAGAEALREAVMVAQRCGDDGELFHAAIHLVHVDALGRDRREAADDWGDLARATLERMGGLQVRDEAKLERELGRVASHHEDLEGALKHYERVLELMGPNATEEDSLVAGTMHDIGIAHARTRRFAAADPVMKESLARYRRIYGDAHPQTAAVLANTGNVAIELGRLDEGLAMHEESLKTRQAALGEVHPATISNLLAMASLHKRRGEHDKALPRLEKALAVAEASKGPEASLTGKVVMMIGNVHSDRGDRKAAVPYQRRALEISTKTRGPHDALTITSMHNLANELFFGAIDFDEALKLYEGAMEATAASGKTPSLERISTLANISALHRVQGRPEPSLAAARRSVALAEELDASANFLGVAHFELARALWATGATTEAHEHAQRALKHSRGGPSIADRERAEKIEAWLTEHPAPKR